MSEFLSILLFIAPHVSDDLCAGYLDQQLAWHREYGLSLPPRAAELIMFKSEWSVRLQQGKIAHVAGPPSLSFSINGDRLWIDTDHSRPALGIRCVTPDPALVRDSISADWRALAVACRERGWNPLAFAAYRKSLFAYGWYSERDIAQLAWHQWECRIQGDPGTPLTLIAKYLKRALPHNDNEPNRALLRSVELALKPRNSPPGSDDALIDELVHARHADQGSYNWTRGWRYEPRYKEIVRRGLDIVPALIAHLDDDRIVRWDCRPASRRTPEHARVRDVVFEILTDLHGKQFATDDKDARNERLAAIGKWFGAAHKLGEEKYVVSQLLGADADEDEFKPVLFWLLTEKYPHRAPDVFRAVIDTRPKLYSYAWAYASAVAEAPVPPNEKRKVLERATTHDHPILRAAGIHHLRPFDPKRAKELLIAAFANLPDGFDDDTAWLARLVAEGTDPDEWKALGFAMRRAGVRGRIRLLTEVGRSESATGRKHRLAFFAEHLTDDELYVGPPHYILSPRFEIRDLAALELVYALAMDGNRPDSDWTAEQWAELRAKVRAKVKEELAR